MHAGGQDHALSYSATLADGSALPGWLSFDPGTRVLSGTPQRADVPSAFSVIVRAKRQSLSMPETPGGAMYTIPLRTRLQPSDCKATPVALANQATVNGTWSPTAQCHAYQFTTTGPAEINITLSSPSGQPRFWLHRGTDTTGGAWKTHLTSRGNAVLTLRPESSVPRGETPMTQGTFTNVARSAPGAVATTPASFTLSLNAEPREGRIRQEFSGCEAPELAARTRQTVGFRADCTSMHRDGQQAFYRTIEIPTPGVGRSAAVKVKICNNVELFLRPGGWPAATDWRGHPDPQGVYPIAEANNPNRSGNRCTLLETRLRHRDGHHWNPEAGDDSPRTFLIEGARMTLGRTAPSVDVEWSTRAECASCAPTIPDIEAQNSFTGLCAHVGVAWTKTLPPATGGNGDPKSIRHRLRKQSHKADFAENGFRFNAGTRVLSGTPKTAITHKLRYVIHDSDSNTHWTDAARINFDLKVAENGQCPGGNPRMQGQEPPNIGPAWPREAFAQLDPTATVGQPFTWTAPEAVDPNEGDMLSYTLLLGNGAPLPEWLTFDPATRTASGTPPRAEVIELQLSVTDSGSPPLGMAVLARVTVGSAEAPTPPTIGALVALEVKRGAEVTLSATATPHAQGSQELAYRWRIAGASNAELAETGASIEDADTAAATYTVARRADMSDASAIDDGQMVDFELTVTDGDTASARLRMTIHGTTEPTPPTVSVMADFEGRRGEEVSLSASASGHAEGSQAPLTVRWRIAGASHPELAGTAAALANPAATSTTYTVARRKDMRDRRALDDGKWIDFELEATDGDGETATDTTRMTIRGTTWQAIQVSVDDAQANESDPTIDFTVKLSAPSRDEVRMNYIAASDQAVANRDFEITQGELVFTPGEKAAHSTNVLIESVILAVVKGSDCFCYLIDGKTLSAFGTRVGGNRSVVPVPARQLRFPSPIDVVWQAPLASIHAASRVLIPGCPNGYRWCW